MIKGNSIRDSVKDSIRDCLANHFHISDAEVDVGLVASIADGVFEVLEIDEADQDKIKYGDCQFILF